jgi:hypothetical protein
MGCVMLEMPVLDDYCISYMKLEQFFVFDKSVSLEPPEAWQIWFDTVEHHSSFIDTVQLKLSEHATKVGAKWPLI